MVPFHINFNMNRVNKLANSLEEPKHVEDTKTGINGIANISL